MSRSNTEIDIFLIRILGFLILQLAVLLIVVNVLLLYLRRTGEKQQ